MKTMISFQCDTLDEARAVIDAVAALGKTPHACSKQYIAPEEIKRAAEPGVQYVSVGVGPRKNVSPGEPSITKIGTNTREEIIGALKRGTQPLDKFREHLKLLWKRGEVKFDGEEYYV